MARPPKKGLDYFPLNVTMDDEIELIEAEHGLEAFAVLIKIFQKIYKNGYFIKWEKKEQILFSNRISLQIEVVNEIISDCAKWGIFDFGLLKKHSVITSRRIQEIYLHAIYKRVEVEMEEAYLLTDVSDIRNVVVNRVSDIKNSPTTDVTDSKSTQSKVNKNKSNENKINENKEKEVNKSNQNYNSIYFKLSKQLHEKILINDKWFNNPDLEKWDEDIRLLIEKEGRPIEDVENVIDWCQSNSFWNSIILSGQSLRKNFSKIIIQMNEDKVKRSGNLTPLPKSILDQINESSELEEEYTPEEVRKINQDAEKYRKILDEKRIKGNTENLHHVQ
ncbi:DUF4373 domain-containing protein [Salipaludibacillus sp. CF4.18]|uniref:DUF4373 domain-containing protein n=1 Tax=Salipaludibacillus sp. CF4.18 TaxID=3373081 RepID=UPI003EE7D5D9